MLQRNLYLLRKIRTLEMSLPILTQMNFQVMAHIQTLHFVIQGKMCPMALAIPLDPQLLSLCLLSRPVQWMNN